MLEQEEGDLGTENAAMQRSVVDVSFNKDCRRIAIALSNEMIEVCFMHK